MEQNIGLITTNRKVLVIFNIFLLLLFFIGCAGSKVHGFLSNSGSYSDMTVHVSLYSFIFGLDDIYGDISPNMFMIIGFIAFVFSCISSIAFNLGPSKGSSIASLIASGISMIGLSPIGVFFGISQYNSTAHGAYDHRISINLMPFIIFIILIIMFVCEYRIHKSYQELS